MIKLPKTKIFNGDCLQVMKTIEDETYSAIITDPPYGLSFMGNRWDYNVPSVEMFQEMIRITKKGGHLLCFGGSRTFHRMACNLEDAGWIIRDTVMWVYSQGFPKSHNISKAIEKKQGLKPSSDGYIPNKKNKVYGTGYGGGRKTKESIPRTELSRLWNGYGTALKPSHEPIIVAMKPMDSSFADNAIKEGVSGFNLKECRVGNEEVTIGRWKDSCSQFEKAGTRKDRPYENVKSKGRWPANLIHDGSEEVTKLFPYSKSGSVRGSYRTTIFGSELKNKISMNIDSSEGSAARFFYCAKPSQKEKSEGCESLPKKQTKGGGGTNNPSAGSAYGSIKAASTNFHPTVKPISLMAYLVRLVKMPKGTKILDPFCGSGTTLVAAIREQVDCDGIEMNIEYARIVQKRTRNERRKLLKRK